MMDFYWDLGEFLIAIERNKTPEFFDPETEYQMRLV